MDDLYNEYKSLQGNTDPAKRGRRRELARQIQAQRRGTPMVTQSPSPSPLSQVPQGANRMPTNPMAGGSFYTTPTQTPISNVPQGANRMVPADVSLQAGQGFNIDPNTIAQIVAQLRGLRGY